MRFVSDNVRVSLVQEPRGWFTGRLANSPAAWLQLFVTCVAVSLQHARCALGTIGVWAAN